MTLTTEQLEAIREIIRRRGYLYGPPAFALLDIIEALTKERDALRKVAAAAVVACDSRGTAHVIMRLQALENALRSTGIAVKKYSYTGESDG